MTAMESHGQKLLLLYVRALGMPADYFDAAFAKPGMTLRLSHYPHTDGNFATFLPPKPVSGLSIRLKDGRWCDIPYMAGAFVVNTGDILAHWSNDVFVSTPHRAINRSGGERYAIPFFLNANPKTVLECLPSCQGPDRPANTRRSPSRPIPSGSSGPTTRICRRARRRSAARPSPHRQGVDQSAIGP